MVYCCSEFQKICLSLSCSKCRIRSILYAKSTLCMLNLCLYLFFIQLELFTVKLELSLRKTILIKTTTSSRHVLKGLNSSKLLEILNSDKTPNKCSTYRLKITFKNLNFVRKPFPICSNIRPLPPPPRVVNI